MQSTLAIARHWWRGTTRGARVVVAAAVGGAVVGAALGLLVLESGGAALAVAAVGVIVAIAPLRGIAERCMGVAALVPASVLWFMVWSAFGFPGPG
ncbi:hypothetical protein Dvina_34085 [Dactylosporangium vinaceum]|uniref:Uncharacterized protein n=1 Tax=Dactylosporangium vinaceum TaxID=53362 RepID=A0ABV5MMB6_9ACTN|nr:hypothetical protein [Dactylosporangium vinaceum]UAB93280.1 hypothetical protein Dvina_34085 [Dactylosporangium vinaceum]